MSEYEIICSVINAHDKEITYKRIQAEIAILQHLGLPTNYLYSCFFRNPHSEELYTTIQWLASGG